MSRDYTYKMDESPLTSLCSVCFRSFRDARGIILRRADSQQQVKDLCTYCQTRYGFDYYVQPVSRKEKNMRKARFTADDE